VIVVSDTSPLNYLVLINAVDLLPTLFGEVFVPAAVMTELQHPKAPARVQEWRKSPPAWLKVMTPTTAIKAADQVDPGEAQAIALAKEIGASLLLIDERKGRLLAVKEGLNVAGTLTVLELAAERGLLDLKAALANLQGTTFRITKRHISAALERDAKRRRP
jgi:predicted nucleic acid-binding protein